MSPAVDVEETIIAALPEDEDGALHVGESLSALLYVVGGICCLAETQTPEALAEEFGEQLQRIVARRQPERLLS